MNRCASAKYCRPGSCSSRRIITDRKPPITPEIMAKIRYIVPMSLWLVENNQRFIPVGVWSSWACVA